ncbi:beta-ketoacyl-[acyl-carrier-protein] synthase family protein [Marinicrinis sediminis]|uniref:Beta-ketoacyl-[acyl-carrier-protein] synthase family protein n=1 Tax=Marinicrinis sediminis TaxID=1652465 RepID=A0ABW5R9H4_9BACL
MSNRVVVTGYGVITPFGPGTARFAETLYQGKHAFKDITSIDTTNSYAKRGGETDMQPRTYRDFAAYCTDAALEMAGLDRERHASLLRGAVVAVGNLGDGAELEAFYREQTQPEQQSQAELARDGQEGGRLAVLERNPFSHADDIGERIGSQMPKVSFTNACIASANAIGYAYDQLKKGRASCALAGGLNVLHPLVFYNFDSSRAMADDVVRPFSQGRTGLLIGDGAAMLVLETMESALKRGARPIAELVGWGISSDGHHVTQPDPTGNGLARSMRMALNRAGISPEEVDYINAHGTGTPLNDRGETKAMKQVFGSHMADIPVSSTKSMTGHMLEATGAVEAVISLEALQRNLIPPTANYLGAEEGLDLDYVVEGARSKELHTVMSNSSAFGGNNCTLIFRKLREG